MIDSDLETTLRRIEIQRLFLPENQELSIGETAGLAQRFLDEYGTRQDLRHLNVSIKLIDRLEAKGGAAKIVDALRSQETAFLQSFPKAGGEA